MKIKVKNLKGLVWLIKANFSSDDEKSYTVQAIENLKIKNKKNFNKKKVIENLNQEIFEIKWKIISDYFKKKVGKEIFNIIKIHYTNKQKTMKSTIESFPDISFQEYKKIIKFGTEEDYKKIVCTKSDILKYIQDIENQLYFFKKSNNKNCLIELGDQVKISIKILNSDIAFQKDIIQHPLYGNKDKIWINILDSTFFKNSKNFGKRIEDAIMINPIKLLKLKRNESKRFSINLKKKTLRTGNFSKDYKIIYKVIIHKIKKKVFSHFNLEFFKKLKKNINLEQNTINHIKKTITIIKKRRFLISNIKKSVNNIFAQKKTDFKIPESILKKCIKDIFNQKIKKSLIEGELKTNINKKKPYMIENSKKKAKEKLKKYFIAYKIIKDYNDEILKISKLSSLENIISETFSN
jgi:hypothetical protein